MGLPYAKPEDLPGFCDNLKYCIEHEHYEDAQRWCQEILNGLFGIVLREKARIVEAVKVIKTSGT